MYQANKLTPDFFYETVAKKTGVTVEVVKTIYSKYLNRLEELSRTEAKIMVRGLGSFELDPKKLIYNLYVLDRKIYAYYSQYINDCVDRPYWVLDRLDKVQKIIKHINQLKSKYAFIEGSMEKFWSNSRGIKELFDHKGDYRVNFTKTDGDLSNLPEEEWDEMWGMRMCSETEDEMSILRMPDSEMGSGDN